MNNNKKYPQDDTLQDLNQHGVKDVIPNEDEEYYTLDLTRGRSKPTENDLPQVELASSNPYDNLDNEDPELAMPHSSSTDDARLVTQVRTDQPKSSNDGGAVAEKDIVDEDVDQGVAVGEPGDTRIDDQTG